MDLLIQVWNRIFEKQTLKQIHEEKKKKSHVAYQHILE